MSCEGQLWVLAASYRLLFALESMLAYLLRSRSSTNEIRIEICQPKKKMVEIAMTGSVQTPEPNGSLEELVESTRREIALGEQLLGRIAREWGGVFKRSKLGDGLEQLSIQLKLARH